MNAQTSEMLLDLMTLVICDAGLSDHGLRPASGERERREVRRRLEKNMAKLQKRYINRHEAYNVLDTDWFYEYLRQFAPVQELLFHVLDRDLWKRTNCFYVRELAAEARAYAADRFGGISDIEERALRNFYRMLMKTVQNTIKSMSKGYLLPGTGQITYGVQYEQASGADAHWTALANRERYLSLIRELLKLGGKQDWTRKEFGEYPWEIFEMRWDLRAVAWDYYLNWDEKSIREWMVCLAGEQWEHYASFYIFCRLKRHRGQGVPKEIEASIRRYYDRNIEAADIKGSVLWKTDSSMSYQGRAVEPLILFAEQFGYAMPKVKARELLFRCAYTGIADQERQMEWLPERYLTKAEIREQVITNMMTEDLKGDVMRWHISYCMDDHIEACAPVILKAAKNPIRNMWVRKEALSYACDMMGIQEVCRGILPGLKGELFFFVAESFCDTENPALADLVWNYGERYPRQKIRSDICLTFMQDKRGVESLCGHLQRRNRAPMEQGALNLAEAIRGIHRVDLADELETLLLAFWRPGFRDNPDDSLIHAAAAALVDIAQSGETGYERVMQILERLMVRFREEEEKVAAIKQWVRESRRGIT